MWVVIEIIESAVPPVTVNVYGPYDSQESAEKRRRVIHLDNYLAGMAHRSPRTYVSEVQP